MSRTNTMTEEQLATARNAFTSQGIDVSSYEATIQGPDCVYAP